MPTMTTLVRPAGPAATLFVPELDGDTLTPAELAEYRQALDETYAESGWLRAAEGFHRMPEEDPRGSVFSYRF